MSLEKLEDVTGRKRRIGKKMDTECWLCLCLFSESQHAAPCHPPPDVSMSGWTAALQSFWRQSSCGLSPRGLKGEALLDLVIDGRAGHQLLFGPKGCWMETEVWACLAGAMWLHGASSGTETRWSQPLLYYTWPIVCT